MNGKGEWGYSALVVWALGDICRWCWKVGLRISLGLVAEKIIRPNSVTITSE